MRYVKSIALTATLNKWVEEFIEGAERKMRGKKEASKSVTEMKKELKSLKWKMKY